MIFSSGTAEISPLLAVSVAAEPLAAFLTNSIFVAAVVTGLILLAARKATTNMQLVPHKAQNFFEFVVEFLYNQVEAIVGKHVAPRAFPLLATIFIFIVSANWFGLVPGVGTIGWGHGSGFFVDHVTRPVLRPATADLNMTLGIAICAMFVWFWLTMRELGPWGFVKHTFAPKGGMTGIVALVLAPIFFFVGVIELISIAFRPVSLSLRLFGNLFAGENLLHAMGDLGHTIGLGPVPAFITSVLIPVPFYFLEILVGLLQAIVFALLCAVYIKLSTTHDEEHH